MKFSYNIKALEKEFNPIFSKLREKVQLSANANKHYLGKVDIKYYKNYKGTSKLLLLEKSHDGGIDLCEYSFSNCFPRFWQKDKDYYI